MKRILMEMSYTITRLAAGTIRIDGELNGRKITMVVDPPRLAARLFDRARTNRTGKAVCLGGAAALTILTPKATEPEI
jgi:hypothetical protein